MSTTTLTKPKKVIGYDAERDCCTKCGKRVEHFLYNFSKMIFCHKCRWHKSIETSKENWLIWSQMSASQQQESKSYIMSYTGI
jgi:recombinational DNA repair protein (RecF pathway)